MTEQTRKRPNVLLIMADQLSALATSPYGNRDVLTPNLQALAAGGAVFQHSYCNYPICVPARMAMVTGRLPLHIESWDNGCELPASTPTLMHHLRLAGYQTLLSGKMHFIGPDQLHGFERRLTTDIYPANYNLYRPWEGQGDPPRGAARMAQPLKSAGPRPWTHQLEYDEEVHFRALEQLRHFGQATGAGGESDRAGHDASDPWFFCVSYTHPHDPPHITAEYWDRYEGRDIALPEAPPPGHEPHLSDIWVQTYTGSDAAGLTREDVYRSRRAYYAMTSYFDDKVGELLRELDRFGLRQDTIVIVTADHGDMVGEHAMWFKRSAREWSARVPLIVSWPGNDAQVPAGRRVRENVSLVDLYPSLLSLLGLEVPQDVPLELDGHDFTPLLRGVAPAGVAPAGMAPAGVALVARGGPGGGTPPWPDEVIIENYGAGTIKPVRAIVGHVDGRRFKYIHVHELPPQLYDLDADPGEWHNLANDPAYATVAAGLGTRLLDGWDGAEVERRIIASQRRRAFVKRALDVGHYHPWDYQPLFDASRVQFWSGRTGPGAQRAVTAGVDRPRPAPA